MPIRPYEAKDRDDVRYICLNSDGPCDADENGQHFLLTAYCDYYIEREPHNCFVFADENDRAVGYILCAEDFFKFREVFLTEFKNRLKPEDTASHGYFLASIELHERYAATHPAHLHIDLLPEYQGKRIGTQLMDTLFAHLKAKNVPAVTLSVWKHNQGGMRFYEKLQFDRLGENANNVAFGKSI